MSSLVDKRVITFLLLLLMLVLTYLAVMKPDRKRFKMAIPKAGYLNISHLSGPTTGKQVCILS